MSKHQTNTPHGTPRSTPVILGSSNSPTPTTRARKRVLDSWSYHHARLLADLLCDQETNRSTRSVLTLGMAEMSAATGIPVPKAKPDKKSWEAIRVTYCDMWRALIAQGEALGISDVQAHHNMLRSPLRDDHPFMIAHASAHHFRMYLHKILFEPECRQRVTESEGTEIHAYYQRSLETLFEERAHHAASLRYYANERSQAERLTPAKLPQPTPANVINLSFWRQSHPRPIKTCAVRVGTEGE